ncbi:hypothetical protein HORIV_37560 [Vreelandella olivaria]|uniref:Uncharacterized protein n=1 Tax=Vreelandella olivaria TaxID=390919 RepID=A0ABM8HL15_9GAMM|nr:hypothetical protein HORIV_37560 [Halomonas olivaria]
MNIPIRGEVVPLWFSLHCRHNAGFKPLGIPRVTAHDGAQIDRMLITQAQKQPPFRGYPNTITGATEIVAMGK